MKKRWVYFLITTLIIITTYIIYFSQLDFFQTIDDKLQDTKFRFRKNLSPSKQVVLVAIDGKSIDAIGRWPWKREVLARLIKRISFFGAKTIALDMVFSETTDKKDDDELAHAIKDANNVVLGYFFRKGLKKNEQEIALNNLPDFSIEDVEVIGDVNNLPIKNFLTAETNISPISHVGVDKGFFSVFPDKDGILRRLHLVAGFDGYLMPSLALAAVSQYLGHPISLVVDKFGVVSMSIGKKKIPVRSPGSILINYYGPGHTITYISAIDILQGRVKRSQLANKLVFIGVTEKAVGDFVPTPTSPNFPGTEVHCTFASNVLQNFYLKRNTTVYLIDLVTILIIPIIILIISIKSKNTFISLTWFFFLGVFYLFINYKLFLDYNIRVATIYPLFEFILSFILLESYRNFIIEQRSKYLKKAFSSYISKELVNELLKYPDKLKLGGEKKSISILFLDIRDFTTISENLTPEELVGLLNRFFGPITDIILKNKGMLDKYIGDAIMALFNVPVDLENHAEAAIKSAIDIIGIVKELNKEFSHIGLPELNVGIGINTGEAVIGNIGTKARFDYTAIGDTVNLASRLEGLNKYYGTNILISQFTYDMLPQGVYNTRFIGEVTVKGKSAPIRVYELMTLVKLHESDIKQFEQGVQMVIKGDFHKAYDIFQEIYEKYDDGVSKYYIDKIDKFKKQGDVCNPKDIQKFNVK